MSDPTPSSRLMRFIRSAWAQMLKFGVIGGIAFVIDTGVYVWLISGPMEHAVVWAKLLASAVATVFAWLGNRYWTFRGSRRRNVGTEAALFFAMNAIGAGIQASAVYVAQRVGVDSVWGLTVAGNVIGLAIATVFRFVSYRWLVFNPGNASPAARSR